MSKISNMAMAIEDLRKCATTINETANLLTEMFSGDESTQEADPTYAEAILSLEAVRAVLAEKSRVGYTNEIRSLLQKYGASRLSGIDPANYNALIADVEGLTDAT